MRRLNNGEISELCVGALNIRECEDGLLRFEKYTESQMDGFGRWTEKSPVLCTTGVRLDFHTDSSQLCFAAATCGKYEVYIDGLLRCFVKVGEREKGADAEPFEEICVRLCDPLGNAKAEHRVTLYLPSHSIGKLSYVSLDDTSYARRHVFAYKFLMIGDSITQGWESKYDSMSYANRVSRFFDAESIVQGRGGSCFVEDTFCRLPNFEPDLITIAYGTNDFSACASLDEMKSHVSPYFDRVKEAYGDRTVLVISPIWRKSREGKRMGSFEECRELVATEAIKRGFIHVDGLELIGNVDDFFTDGLHPNDLGFSVFSENLIRIMQKYVK